MTTPQKVPPTPIEHKSSVTVGTQVLHVRSRVIVEPEVMIVNEIMDDAGAVLKKDHAPVPSATVQDYRRRGQEALASGLQIAHLRFVQRLLCTPSGTEDSQQRDSRTAAAPRRGVLATQLFGPNGNVLRSMGEEQVPGSWLQIGYRVAALAELAASRLGLGSVRVCVAAGDNIAAVLSAGHETKVCFVDPAEVRSVDDVGRQMEAI